MQSKRILIGSPIHQKPHILVEFLESLKELNKEQLEITYLFVDDNVDEQSKQVLNQFSMDVENVIISPSEEKESYICNEITHQWKESLIWKVAKFKNMFIQIAIENNFDYLFLIDSDIVLHPETLQQLVATNKDIISEIFWTKWAPEAPDLPQVWLTDHYTQYDRGRNEQLSNNQALIRRQYFLSHLRQPGVYEVGGLGACTLISRDALKKGVNFSEIKNITFWGEDRHFCIRAAALGIPLHVDTYYPAYHIYRETDLEGVQAFKERRMMNNPDAEDTLFTSRFFKTDDPKINKFVFDLPKDWWSRFYEYEWASNFVEKDDVSLDAACGISHPFKFHLYDQGNEVYACDLDERIMMKEKIIKDINDVFGEDNATSFSSKYLDEINYSRANLTSLPYEEQKFNKVYCISVLEHLPQADIKTAFLEFRRVLRDDGQIILTFDFPTINLDFLLATVKEVGLKFAGDVDTKLLDENLSTDLWDGLCCFRAVLVKDDMDKQIMSNLKSKFQYRKYWENNYAVGGTSGSGSYGQLAEFKGEVINDLIQENDIQTVIEFGCGDGNQLKYMNYKNYLGFDIANSAVQLCKEKFSNDQSKEFKVYDPVTFDKGSLKADLVVCLDVLYHIIDDDDFAHTLKNIFSSASKYVVLYTRITGDHEPEFVVTIKDRDILKAISHLSEFRINAIIKQRYPELSSADFIILERIE